MCTVIILRRPGHEWPLLVASNRDEMSDRPWRAPGRHWPDRPEVVGGLDVAAGGSWLGLNDSGVLAAVLNRAGTLGPAAGRRSRGELVLEALDHADSAGAADALGHLNPRAYRPFNMVVADDRDAFCLYHRDESGVAAVVVEPIPSGLSMITAYDRNDPADPRVRAGLPRFARAPSPDPKTGTWTDWQALLGSRETASEGGPQSALCFSTPEGFATSSSALIALPTRSRFHEESPVWLFAAGPPDQAPWQPISGLPR